MQISEIVLNNYRAFFNEKGKETEKYKIDFKGKKNMLIYGENGSGKSSLFRGIKDLFVSSAKPEMEFIQNVFSKEIELDIQPFVQLTFSHEDTLEIYTFSKEPDVSNTTEEILRKVAKTKSFMTYRDLLRVHFEESSKANLFNFLFVGSDSLLGEIDNPASTQAETSIKMYALWENVRSDPDETNRKDFTNGANQILMDLSQSLNCLLKYFDDSLEISFDPLTLIMVEENKPVLKLNVKYFGKDLNLESEQYHHFLNEARLSALAVCIFLSTHLSVPKGDYEILFLDDIFTGLDTSNRMPLLDILTAHVIEGTASDTFKNHQIILTTYDRNWYKLARNYLGEGDWTYQEIFIDKHSEGFHQPVLKPGEDDYQRASFYFKIKHYPACANHQRKLCESLIKRFLPDHKKYLSLPNGSIEPIDKLATLIRNFISYLTENGIDPTPFDKLPDVLRIVMNPLSHDDLESPAYRREIEMVFDIIKELRKLKNEILIKQGEVLRTTQKHKDTGVEYQYEFEVQTSVRLIETDSESRLSKILIRPLKVTQMDNKKETKLGYEPEAIEKSLKSVTNFLKITENLDYLDEFEWNNGKDFQTLANIINP